jgi:hypothetical protein
MAETYQIIQQNLIGKNEFTSSRSRYLSFIFPNPKKEKFNVAGPDDLDRILLFINFVPTFCSEKFPLNNDQ